MENPENTPKIEDTVLLSREQFEALIAQDQELKADIIALVNVFQNITTLFSGKTNAFQMAPTIMKLISDPKKLEAFQHIVPIIEKYLPENSNGQ